MTDTEPMNLRLEAIGRQLDEVESGERPIPRTHAYAKESKALVRIWGAIQFSTWPPRTDDIRPKTKGN